jgi:glycosyltransferase involved in cell wall biosynthesis
MIACFAKHDRASVLFSELRKLNPAFKDIGVAGPDRSVVYLSALLSIRPNYRQFYTDTYFSPFVARNMEKKGCELLAHHPEASAVLYWGAMNFPMDLKQCALPYCIITDGPYDPDDRTYPVEWKPRRWSTNYFERQRRIYRGAEHVFTLSEWAREKLISVHNLPPEQVTRMGWGPMHAGGTPGFEMERSGYFLSVGNEWARKGMDCVADAGARFHRKYPEARTIIVGNPRGLKIPTMPGVTQIPNALPGSEIQPLISNARCLIIGSRFDASPHVAFEALQAGTPVIGTAVAGIPEAVQEPNGGYVFPVGDVVALVASMEKIWTANVQSQRESAYRVYQQSGGWSGCARTIAEVMGVEIRDDVPPKSAVHPGT